MGVTVLFRTWNVKYPVGVLQSFSNFSHIAGREEMKDSFPESRLGVLMPEEFSVLGFVRVLDIDEELDTVTSTMPFKGLYLTALLSKQYSTRLK